MDERALLCADRAVPKVTTNLEHRETTDPRSRNLVDVVRYEVQVYLVLAMEGPIGGVVFREGFQRDKGTEDLIDHTAAINADALDPPLVLVWRSLIRPCFVYDVHSPGLLYRKIQLLACGHV